jgi:hypothetical protein
MSTMTIHSLPSTGVPVLTPPAFDVCAAATGIRAKRNGAIAIGLTIEFQDDIGDIRNALGRSGMVKG